MNILISIQPQLSTAEKKLIRNGVNLIVRTVEDIVVTKTCTTDKSCSFNILHTNDTKLIPSTILNRQVYHPFLKLVIKSS